MKPGINYGLFFLEVLIVVNILFSKKTKHKLNILPTHGKRYAANKVLSKKFQNSINYNKLELINVSNLILSNLEETYKKFLYPLSSHDLPVEI